MLEPRGDGRGPVGVRRLRVSTRAIIFSLIALSSTLPTAPVIQITSDPYTLHIEWNYFAAFIAAARELRLKALSNARLRHLKFFCHSVTSSGVESTCAAIISSGTPLPRSVRANSRRTARAAKVWVADC